MIKQNGYLWSCYGFTKTHMWGLHLVGGVLTLSGFCLLGYALTQLTTLDDKMFYRLVASSAVVLLTAIVVVLYSLFHIFFYRFADEMSHKSGETRDAAGR